MINPSKSTPVKTVSARRERRERWPVVALIGQTNAGKSSILNRLARRPVAIVAREEGTTRDNVVARIEFGEGDGRARGGRDGVGAEDNNTRGRKNSQQPGAGGFILVDTAGLKDPEDEFEAGIQEQIEEAVAVAEVILVVVDATKFPDHRDKEIARKALKSRKPVLLLLNKSDKGEALGWEEFQSLGVKATEAVRTSATTGQGMRELVGKVRGALGQVMTQPAPVAGANEGAKTENVKAKNTPTANFNAYAGPAADLKIALIGRPNVGKSSLFNTLAKKQQAIVSARQGTTRDVNRVRVRYKGRELEILDTAGLRRPGRREVGIEKFSAVRTLAAIEEADVCALLVDGTEPRVKLDQSLAGEIVEAGKGIIFIITKMDLVVHGRKSSSGASSASADARFARRTPSAPRSSAPASLNKPPEEDLSERQLNGAERVGEILDDLERDFDFLPYAPVILTSSETGQNVTKLFELALEIDAARQMEFKTSDLNRILQEAVAAHPPAGLKNTHPKLKYMVQTDVAPPWFVVYGRELGLLHWSYKRYLERRVREVYPLVGTPIFFSFREEK